MLRADLHPTGGGCLCLGGDCPNCLVTVDGVAYTRSCQVPARDGMVVRRDHLGGEAPRLLPVEPMSAGNPAPAHHVHCDTVVIGQGDSGREAAREARAAGLDVVTVDARNGQQVTGVYPGPLVVASDRGGRVLHVHPRREIVVATGAAEIQPIVPGSDLEGLVTGRAAAEFAGIDLGRVVAVGELPAETPAYAVAAHLPIGEGGWELVRFEGNGRIEAVVVRRYADRDAPEDRFACDTAVLGLGRNPRNALARMASDLPVRVVGGAAAEPELPPCPREGTVCPCSGVTVADLDGVWDRGFREMELLKRATLAGTGACQGGVCLPYLRRFLLERGGRLQPAFTARPLNRHLTVRELAAGAHTPVTARSPLHDEHLRLGARMDRAGGWWRPWTYGQAHDEYTAVRDGVSLGDVSSLGKMAIAGPDAEAFLERIVPTRVATIRPGRCRYVLMLDERGYVLDDGMLCREEAPRACAAETGCAGPPSVRPLTGARTGSRVTRDRATRVLAGNRREAPASGPSAAPGDGDRFFFTSTSGGSSFFELWLRDWAEAFGFDVRILNQTASLAAINVTGPSAALLLSRAGARDLPAFSRHRRLRIAGIDCRVVRLSFTGELSYELHHAAADAGRLWRQLLALGGDLNVRPHGLETLLHLRLEKGHIVIGQDTDYDSTPRRLGHEWAVDLNKRDFIGRQAIVRTNKQPPDRRLVLLWMDELGGCAEETGCAGVPAGIRREAPASGSAAAPALPERRSSSAEGSAIHDGDRYAGYATSHAPGPSGDRLSADRGTPLLGWLYVDENGNLPREVTIDGRLARRVDDPTYDPQGKRARVAVDLTNDAPGDPGEFEPKRRESTDPAAAVPVGPPQLHPLEATRVAAAPAALDALVAQPPWPANALAFRTAPDELLVTAALDFEVAGDLHAIVERETGFSYVWLDAASTERFLERECDWERLGAAELPETDASRRMPAGTRVARSRATREPVRAPVSGRTDGTPAHPVSAPQAPSARPTLAQGEVAGIPAKLWFETGRTLILTPSPFAAAFQRRLTAALAQADGASR